MSLHPADESGSVKEVEIADAVFGAVRTFIDSSGGVVMVEGQSVPTATLSLRGPRTRSDVPIGTRRTDRLSLAVDGTRWSIVPSQGSWSRRSYRVVVERPGSIWLFTAATSQEHRLVRGATYRGGNELGMFREVEGVVTAEWSKEVRIGSRVVVDAPPPMAEECALGYLLAGAFGTGAQLMGPSLVSGLMNALMPG